MSDIKCANCGSPYSEGASFCALCGSKFPHTEWLEEPQVHLPAFDAPVAEPILLVGTGRRFLAPLIDLSVPTLVSAVVIMIGIVMTGVPTSATDLSSLWLFHGIAGLLSLAWFIVMIISQGRTGSTLGNAMVKIRLVDATTNQPAGFGRALLWWLVICVSGVIPLLLPLLVLISPAFDSSGRGQGWHDKLAKLVAVPRAEVLSAPAAYAPSWGTAAASPMAPEYHPATQSADPYSTDPYSADPWAVPAGHMSSQPLDPWSQASPHQSHHGAAYEMGAGQAPVGYGVEPWAQTVMPSEQVVAHPWAAPEVTPTPWDADVPGHAAAMPGPPAGLGAPVPSVPQGSSQPVPTPTPPASIPVISPPPAQAPPAPIKLGSPVFDPPSRIESPQQPPHGQAAPMADAPAEYGVTPLVGGSLRPVSLQLDDGVAVVISGPTLMGRNPQAAPGTSWSLVPLTDPSRSVSKTHLELDVDEQGLWVMDRGSTNGTVVILAGHSPRKLAPGERVHVPVDSVVHVGDRRLVVRAGAV